MRIKIYHREGGVPYRGEAQLISLWDGSGAGFDFYPQDGPKMKCMIPNESNDVINRATGIKIGEYDPMWRHAVLNLGEEQEMR